jgi:tryptophan-rich sensory protein
MLAYHISIPVICAIAMNGIMYIYNLNNNKSPQKYIPPGYIIGTIWTIIFALLGYVHYRLYTLHNTINYGSVSIVLFILVSLVYPLINAMNEKYGYFLNLISLILSFTVSLIVMMYSKHIFLYLIPLLLWVSFVNLVILYNILYV